MKHAELKAELTGQLQWLWDMLDSMAKRGQQISTGCRRYWCGRYEQLLDTAARLGCLDAREDVSWRQAFGAVLALLVDFESMRRARRKNQEGQVPA